MSTLSFTQGSSCPTNSYGEEFNRFFAESDKIKVPNASKVVVVPVVVHTSATKCADWIVDHNFQQQPDDDSGDSPKQSEFSGSPLPESVTSCLGLNGNLEQKRKNSVDFEAESLEKRQKTGSALADDDPPPKADAPPSKADDSPSFFEILDNARKEVREGSEKWVKINEIWMEKTQPQEDSEDTDRTLSKYEELTSLFAKNSRLFDSVTFIYSYKFDWKRFSEGQMQYIVFTKYCQSHPPGETVEMKKEAKKCTVCDSTNLAVSVRLTAPLDLSDTPLPHFDDTEVHVAFPVRSLMEEAGMDPMTAQETMNQHFSNQKCEKMYQLYQKLAEGEGSDEYAAWFEMCKRLVTACLTSKRLRLDTGRVIRRKVEDTVLFEKKRCFMFATLFQLE